MGGDQYCEDDWSWGGGGGGGGCKYIYGESVMICRHERSVFWSSARVKQNPVPCCNSRRSMLLKHLVTACNKLPTKQCGEETHTQHECVSVRRGRSRAAGGRDFLGLFYCRYQTQRIKPQEFVLFFSRSAEKIIKSSFSFRKFIKDVNNLKRTFCF